MILNLITQLIISNYLGIDLGRYFSNYRHLDDMFGNETIPSDAEMGIFLEEYRLGCSQVQGEHYLKQEINSMKQLLKETKSKEKLKGTKTLK